MSLLPQTDRAFMSSTTLPPSWTSNLEDREAAADVAAFLTVIDRMAKYEKNSLELVNSLSHGTSFQVEVCKEKASGILVAVKRLNTHNQDVSSSSSVPSSVLKEMMVSIWPPFLEDPNITRTLGYQNYRSDDGTSVLNLVLEYSDIGSLGSFLSDGSLSGENDWKQKRALSIDIASAIECLHRCRVIHGDLKPDNILLFPRTGNNSGFELMAKLVDFGNSIIEDEYSKNFRVLSDQDSYYGTLIWVPPLVRHSENIVPFEEMPICDVFSFGLILWSIYKGAIYYETSWPNAGQSDKEYLLSLDVPAYKDHFLKFLQTQSEMPEAESSVLRDSFHQSTTWAEWKEQEDLGIPRPDTDLDSMFKLITTVKDTLLEGVSAVFQKSGVIFKEHSWLPFDLGQLHFEGNDNVPWVLQVSYHQGLLKTITDPHISGYQKGEASMELASCSAIGFGCMKSIHETLRYLHMATNFQDFDAHLVANRLFGVHNQDAPVPEAVKLSNLSETPPDSIGNHGSDTAREDSPDDNKADNSFLADFSHGQEDNAKIPPCTNSDLRSIREPDAKYSLFYLSRAMYNEFWDSGLPNRQYYCWHLRNTHYLLGSAGIDTQFELGSDTIEGMDDPRLFELAKVTWLSKKTVKLVCGESGDDAAEEDSLVHRAVIMQKTDLMIALLDIGMDVNSTDSNERTLLQIACRWGNMTAVEALIARGAKANIHARGGDLPLHWLWMFEDPRSICSLLIDRGGADVNAFMNQYDQFNEEWTFLIVGGTALHAAVAARSLETVEVLLDSGADINCRPFDESSTPIELAAELHLPEVVQYLLDRGATLETEADHSWALHHVGFHISPFRRWMIHGADFEQAATEVVRVLVKGAERQKLSLDEVDHNGITAFQLALSEHGEELYIVEAFLNNGFRLEKFALDMAISSCSSNEENASKVQLVLKQGPNDLFDWAASLKLAIEHDALAAIRELAQHCGTEILDSKSQDLGTPLHWAVKVGSASILRYLIEENVNLNVFDKSGIPPIGNALKSRSQEMTTILLDAGVELEINEGEYAGSSVLIFALSTDPVASKSMLVFLLSAYAEEDEQPQFPALHDQAILNASDLLEGDTVLHKAAACGDADGVFSLIKAGALSEIRNQAGQTPLQKAEQAMENCSLVGQKEAFKSVIQRLRN